MSKELYKENKPKKKVGKIIGISLLIFALFIVAIFVYANLSAMYRENEQDQKMKDGVQSLLEEGNYINKLRDVSFSDLEVSTDVKIQKSKYGFKSVDVNINYSSEELGKLIKDGKYEEAIIKMYNILPVHNEIENKCYDIRDLAYNVDYSKRYRQMIYLDVSASGSLTGSVSKKWITVLTGEGIYDKCELYYDGEDESVMLSWGRDNLFYGHPYVKKDGFDMEILSVVDYFDYMETDEYKEKNPAPEPTPEPTKSNYVYTPPQSTQNEKPAIYDPYNALGYGDSYSFYEAHSGSFSCYEEAANYYWEVHDQLEEYYDGDVTEYEDTGY